MSSIRDFTQRYQTRQHGALDSSCLFSICSSQILSMHPSGEIIPREIIDRACHETSCTHTKLRGYAMSFCKPCQSVFYCVRLSLSPSTPLIRRLCQSVACQRKDWPRHKSFCRMQAAELAREAPAAGRLPQIFEAWRLAMGPPMFSCLVVGGV
jgi:hypothetical protein